MAHNIAFIHAGFPGGGAERITKDIATYLSRFGDRYRVFVLTTHIDKDLLTPAHIENITLVPIQDYSVNELTQAITANRINTLVQSSYPVKDISKIKKATGIKVVFACHEEPFWRRYLTEQRGFFRKLVYKSLPKAIKPAFSYRIAVKWTAKAYRSCDAFTTLCKEYVEIIRKGLKLGESHHIYAIENPEYIIEDVKYDKNKIILYSGRLDQMSKQLHKLLNIWRMVQDDMSDWKLVITGDGPDKDFLLKEAARLELKRCEFVGQQKKMQPFYDKASIVCLTSRTEGWPLCLTEAQASGCIPVAFGCTAGVIDILSDTEHGTCGFCIVPYDEHAYAETLKAIASMPKDRQYEIRKNAVKKRSLYAPEIIAEKWRILFDNLQPNL